MQVCLWILDYHLVIHFKEGDMLKPSDQSILYYEQISRQIMKIRNQIIALSLFALFFMSAYIKPIQGENANTIEIVNLQVQPTKIRVGDTFAINATLVNNSTNTINVRNGCGGSFSVVFDNHATSEVGKICNWMAVQIILKPGENFTGSSLFSNLAYKAIMPGTANSTVTFSYVVSNQTSPNLLFENNSSNISKSFSFTISNQSANTTTTIPPPLKQFKSGIAAKDIKCQEGLQLVIKTEDGSPACVTSTTAQKLVERGWGISAT